VSDESISAVRWKPTSTRRRRCGMRTHRASDHNRGMRRSEAGMTLIETMVAVALLGIVALAFYQTYNESQRHLLKGQAVMDMQQNTRVALETIAGELRSARSIEVMEEDRVSFVSDLFTTGQTRMLMVDLEDRDGDGNTDELLLHREPGDDGNATTQTDEVATSVGGLRFRYLNSLDGASEAQAPSQIRRVEVTVSGRLPNQFADSTEISFSTVVRPRNLRLPQPPNPDGDAPAAPTNVYLAPTCGVVDITWDANTEDDLAGYRVFYKTGSSGEPYAGTGAAQGSSPIFVGNRTSFQLTGLAPDETYYIVLTAVDVSANESAYSLERVTIPNDGSAPGAPTGVAAEVGGEDALVVAWTKNPEADVAFYRVYYDTDESGPPYAESDSTGIAGIRLEGLETGSTHYIAVTAGDECGNESPYSEEITAVPKPCSEDATPPAVPQGLDGTAGDCKAVLDWSANTEPDLSTYRLFYTWASGADSVDVGTGTHYELHGLINETDYTFCLAAVDACGNRSGKSASIVIRPMTCAGDDVPPAAPSFVVVEDARSEYGDALILSWLPSGDPDLAGYWVYYGSASHSYGTPIDVGKEVFHVLDGLVPEETYFISVVAYDRCANASGYSLEETGVPTYGCTCNPTAFFVYPTNGSILYDNVPVATSVNGCPDQVVLKVEFQINGFPERTWLEPPFSCSWDTQRWPDGYYQLVLSATDNHDCCGQDTIEVLIDNTGTGPGCVRVDPTVPVSLGGAFDEEVNFGILNTSAVQACDLTAITAGWTSETPELSVARLHRIEIPAGTEVWDAGPLVDDAASSGETITLDSPFALPGSGKESARFFFWHENGEWNPGGAENMPMYGATIKLQSEVSPYRVCPADSFISGCTIAVTHLEVTSSRPYETAYLGVGDRYYTDRNYVIEGIPAGFEGLQWIKTANNDKLEGSDFTLEFDVDRRVMVYIAFDPRGDPPAWITNYYTPVGLSIDVSDNQVDVLNLWAREYPEGHIALSGNRAPGAGLEVKTNYVVILDCR